MTSAQTERGLIFDLDGTLVDTVYVHVLAWQRALEGGGMSIPGWRVHRRIGMSGGLFVRGVAREIGRDLDDSEIERLRDLHESWYARLATNRRPLPGAPELIRTLDHHEVPWAIATSGSAEAVAPSLSDLGVRPNAVVVTRTEVARAKPEPDLFLRAAERLGLDPPQAIVVGDSTWDVLAARRAGMLAVGLLTGGYAAEELERAGAYRVYEDPRALDAHLDELGLL